MNRIAPFDQLDFAVASRSELLQVGMTGASLTAAVRHGDLIRARRDHYLHADAGRHLIEATRIGGRLGCVSALRAIGVFALQPVRAHVHIERSASRLRAPSSRRMQLTSNNRGGCVLHWLPREVPEENRLWSIGLEDALAQAMLCQMPWHAVASLDNASHLGLIGEAHLASIFHRMPARLQPLRATLDSRSESGQESVLRCALVAAGMQPELQVIVGGVGRVDFLLEGKLVVEADSRLAHDGWELHVRDRDRDLDLARLGYASLRPAYQRTMHRTAEVVDAVHTLLDAMGGFRRVL